MRRNQYAKVNDKKVLHKVKKQWVVISSAILMAMSSGMVVNHITQKPTSMIDTIETQASGLHNHLLQLGLRAHADTVPQSSTSGQPVNVQKASNNNQSVSSQVDQQPNNNGQSAVTINTSKGPVAVSNTPYNSQIAKQQQVAASAQNAAINGNTYQSSSSTDAQNLSSNIPSGNSLNQQPTNNGSQSAVTINTSRGPVAVSNTPHNSQIAQQQAANAQNTSAGTSLSDNSSESSNRHIHINLQSTPPTERLSEKKLQHQPVWYTDKDGRKYDIAPGAVFDAGNIGKNNKDVKGRIIKNPYMRFEDTYKVGQLNTVNDTYPSVPYTLNGDDDLFKEKPIPKNWKLYGISDNQVSHLNLDQLQKNFNYEDPKYNFVYNANNGKMSKNYMYTFSPNYIRSDGGSYIQVPNRRRLDGPNGIPSPYRLKVFNVPQQDTVKFNGLKAGTIVNNLAIGKVGNDFGNSDPGLNLNNPENISAPVGYHFVATGSSRSDACHSFSLNNYVPDIGSDGVVYYNYGQSDNYNDTVSDTNTNSNFNNHSGNNYYFKHFNIGTIDGSFITLNVAPDTERVIYTYNGNPVDIATSDNYTYNSDKKYNTDKNGNPIADVLTSDIHPGLPSNSGYHLVNKPTLVPFNNGTMDVPIEPNTFAFNYVDNKHRSIPGRNQTGSDYHYNQPKGPTISDIVNNINNNVPSGYTLVNGQINNLSYDNKRYSFVVVPTSSLKKTIYRTIHYENDNNQPRHDIASTVSQPITYNRTVSINNNSASYTPFNYSSGTGTWNAIATPNLSSLGYKSAESPYAQSVPSSATPSNSDQASNCSIIVYYPDSDATVTPNNPGNPNSKIPDGSSNWPNGTSRDDLTKTITRTIEYRNQDGSSLASNVVQNVTYNRSMTVDKVTGQFSTSPWYAQNNVASWAQVNSPSMSGQGYGTPYVYSDTDHQVPQNTVADSISSSNVGVSDHNQTIDVRYPDIITTITANTPKTPGTKINSDNNVTWPKGTDSDSLTRKITRTINYINSRGQTLAPTVKQTVTYNQTVNVDHVTGKIISTSPWTAKNGLNTWSAQTSPNMSSQGYGIPYTYEENSSLIPQNQRMTNVTAKYVPSPSDHTTANDETIDVLYPDTSTTITPSSAKTPGTKINPGSNVVWPNGTDKNSLTKTVTRTIHYVNERGQKVAPSDVQNVTFYCTVTVDNATGNIINYTNWSTNNPDNPEKVLLGVSSPNLGQREGSNSGKVGSTNNNAKNIWSDVTSPNLSNQGYGKPNKSSVAQQIVEATDPSVNVTVIYPDKISNQTIPNPNTITRTIYYQDSKTGQEIASPVTQKVTYTRVIKRNSVTGQVNSDWQTNHNTWSDVTSPLNIRGYSAPSLNNVPATTVNYDDHNQTIVVKYNPGTFNKRLSQTTTQTINYVGPDGKEIPGVAPNKQTIHFNCTVTVDRVTGQMISHSNWQPSNGYVSVTSPDEASRGYIYPNQDVINGNDPHDPAIGNTTITVQYQRAKPAPVPKPKSNAPASGSPAQPTSTPSSGSDRPGSNLPNSGSLWYPTSGSASSSNNRPGSHIPMSNSPWQPISRPSNKNRGSNSSTSSTPDSSSSLRPTPYSANGGNTLRPNAPGSSSSWSPTPNFASNGNQHRSNVPESDYSWHPSSSSVNGDDTAGPNVPGSDSSWQPMSKSINENDESGTNAPKSSSFWHLTSKPSSENNGIRTGVPRSNSSWHPTSKATNEHNKFNLNYKLSTSKSSIRIGASPSSMSSSNIYNSNKELSNLGFKPLRRHTPMFSKSRRNASYPFIKLDADKHTTPRREDRHLPQTGENHNYSGLLGAIMTLAATLIAALGRGFDRRHNK